MPHILVQIPQGSFPDASRTDLVRRINDAVASAEQIPNEPRKRMMCWVLIDEVANGAWSCGGTDVTPQMLPCSATVYVPEGVLDHASRSAFIQAAHEAFQKSMPTGDTRPLATSIMVHEVVDGTWGVNGAIWKLPQFAKAAGYAHLQHLVSA